MKRKDISFDGKKKYATLFQDSASPSPDILKAEHTSIKAMLIERACRALESGRLEIEGVFEKKLKILILGDAGGQKYSITRNEITTIRRFHKNSRFDC